MKVLLINSWQPMHSSTLHSFGIEWPLGVLYVAAATRAAGYEVDVYDAAIGGNTTWLRNKEFKLFHSASSVSGYPEDIKLMGASIHTLKTVLNMSRPDVVGLSLTFSSQHMFVPLFIQLIKEWSTDVKIVVGGTHATLGAELLAEIEGIDYIVTGEGEVAFPKLLAAIDNNESTDNIAGVYPTPFELIEDVDTLSYPALDLVSPFPYYMADGYPVCQIVSSRGCPSSCRFCSSPYLTRRKWRPHSVQRVLKEIARMIDGGVQEIRFVDDNAALDNNRWKAILEGIIRNGWRLTLSACSFHGRTLDKESLMLMRLAGFKRVMFAPESGNDRVVKELIGKNITVAESEQLVHNITEAGLIPDLNIMIGMLGETRQEIQDTIDFCRRIKEYNPKCGAWVSCATPMLHTELYDEAVAKGVYPGGVPELFSYAVATYDGEDWTKEELAELWQFLNAHMNYNGGESE